MNVNVRRPGAVLRRRFGPSLRGAALAFACLLAMSSARADVWGYVDSQGTAHFATERLDERYELFARGSGTFQSGEAAPAGESGQRPVDVSRSAPRLLAYFDASPSYKAAQPHLREASSQHNIDYELLKALIATESGFDARAVSPKGAVGLMQLMPATAERYGVAPDKRTSIEKKLTDPRTNIRAGSRYLSDLLRLFPGRLDLALAAYNAGEGAVLRAGHRVPNYRETQNYVRTVMQLYTLLKPPASETAPRATGRVRMELPTGGARGRGNMISAPWPGFAPSAAPSSPSEQP
jgi:soluble lytic murein transglycosylase-like protein